MKHTIFTLFIATMAFVGCKKEQLEPQITPADMLVLYNRIMTTIYNGQAQLATNGVPFLAIPPANRDVIRIDIKAAWSLSSSGLNASGYHFANAVTYGIPVL